MFVVCAVQKPCSAQAIDATVIAHLESNGNPFARNGGHYGLCQIGPEVLKDYNRAHGTIWGMQDLYNGVINLRVARWYLNEEIPRLLAHYKQPDTVQNRITAWRFGVGAVKKGKVSKGYLKAYRKLTKEAK